MRFWILIFFSYVFVFAEDAMFQMRLNKNFIQDVFANNLKPIFEHIDSIKIANSQLNEIDLQLEKILLKVVSEKKGSALTTELTFDEED